MDAERDGVDDRGGAVGPTHNYGHSDHLKRTVADL
jgi:hypothetical protein